MSTQSATAGSAAGKNWLGLSYGNVSYRSQLVAYPYFIISAILFVKQIVFGLIMASQYVWPSFLVDSMPFNVARASHLNLLIFWLLLGLIGAAYYLIPEETERELFSVPLAYLQLVILLIAGLGSMTSFWFLRDLMPSIGKPFTEAPMPWPWFIAVGMVIFLVNIGMTIIKSGKYTAVPVILLSGMTGLSVFYLIDLKFFPNLVVDFYWWWWIIHLWVEGAWELIIAAITAFLLIKMTGVSRKTMYRLLYVEVALVLFTGIIGIGHHYYWIGTPDYWLWWGAIFSALEPVPIALMVYDAIRHMKKTGSEPVNRVAFYWLAGGTIGHFFGAGVWGFAQTLPQVNKWTHGTLATAAHGHFAFFTAFAMVVIAAIYYMVPRLRGLGLIRETRGLWAFWLTVSGMLTIVAAMTIAGIVQTYLWRVIGMDFMVVRTEYLTIWMVIVLIAGLALVTPGVLLYAWDFFFMKSARRKDTASDTVAGEPAAGIVATPDATVPQEG